ncbi:unnamed protein product [Mytilus coruscus]|uniref:Uncharacterized protein n=1 Tax=Mytilus coruscus TaxID=42192 RepID=A0A6J8AGI0_MYTCO|nr:unnamed protein product [Mytilus coruscus]
MLQLAQKAKSPPDDAATCSKAKSPPDDAATCSKAKSPPDDAATCSKAKSLPDDASTRTKTIQKTTSPNQTESSAPATKAKIKRKSIQPVKKQITKEDAMKDSMSIINDAIFKSKSNPIVLMNTELQQGLAKVASVLQDGSSSSSRFAENLVDKFWPIVSGITEKPTTDALDKMCTKFHQLSLQPEFIAIIENFLQQSEIIFDTCKSTILIQCLLEGLTRSFINKAVQESYLVFDMPNEDATCSASMQLSVQEEQALRYTAGYIAQSLLKSYEKRKESNKVAAAYCSVLSSWNESMSCNIQSANFLSYTRRLVEFADRGGLFSIKDQVFIFFRRMEITLKPHLQHCKDFLQFNLKQELTVKLTESRIVQLGWESICELNENMSTVLLGIIIDRWIKLHYMLAQSCIFLRKIKNEKIPLKKGQKD